MGNILTDSAIMHINNSSPINQLYGGLGSRLDEALLMSPYLWPGTAWYVDPDNSDDSKNGLTPGDAFATLQKAIDNVSSHDSIFVRGDLTESVSTPVYGASGTGVVGVRIIAAQAGPGYPESTNKWSSVDGTTTPQLIIRSLGWSVEGFRFFCPSATGAIRMLCYYSDGLVYDATGVNRAVNTKIIGNCFYWGLYGIEAYGMPNEVQVLGNDFDLQVETGGMAIIGKAVGYAFPFRWHVYKNIFHEGLGAVDFHIVGANGCFFMNNTIQNFGTQTGIYNLNLGGLGGAYGNIIWNNVLGGLFEEIVYKKASAADLWYRNDTEDGVNQSSQPAP